MVVAAVDVPRAFLDGLSDDNENAARAIEQL